MIKRNHELLRRSRLFKHEMALQVFEEEDFYLGMHAGKKMAWDGNINYARRFYSEQGGVGTFALGVGVGFAIGRAWTVDLEL